MRAVGVRELKNRLSEYLRLVRNGEQILVTDRGDVIAELRQPSSRLAVPYPQLSEAVRRGEARLGRPNRPDLYPALGRVMPAGAAARASRPGARRALNLYAESSAVLCWLLDEPRAPEVREALASAELVLASSLTLIECDRVLIREWPRTP